MEYQRIEEVQGRKLSEAIDYERVSELRQGRKLSEGKWVLENPSVTLAALQEEVPKVNRLAGE